MSNIVHITKTKDKPEYVSRIKNAASAMARLRYEMHMWAPKDLAMAVGCHVSTIYAVKSGRTKWPRPKTFFALLEVLDLEMHLTKK